MKAANIVTEAGRVSETGQTWEEQITNSTGSFEAYRHQAVRVRATGATTVTLDGILAMTMSSGEIAIFNTGDGNPDNTKVTVTVAIAGAAAFVQTARETRRVHLQPTTFPQAYPSVVSP
jgi:hypothetical protein